jgi:outer membrane lipoprotein-sorting protein
MVDGPSTQTLDRALAALDAAASFSKNRVAFRRKTMFALLKMAAAVLIAAGSLFYFGGRYLVGAPVAFEEVAQKLENAHTLSYVMTMEFPDAKSAATMRHLFKEPGLLRMETLPAGALPAGGPILIMDQKADKTLAIDPAAKSAVLLEGRLPGAGREDKDLAISEAQYLRSLAQKKGEPIGEKAFGKVQAQGFRVKDDTRYMFDLTIWVDPQARLPVQVEITGKAGDKPFHSTIRDFELDPKLDNSLFSQEPPQGYAFSRFNLNDPNDKDDSSPEVTVGKLLRDFAEKSVGAFPKRLDD